MDFKTAPEQLVNFVSIFQIFSFFLINCSWFTRKFNCYDLGFLAMNSSDNTSISLSIVVLYRVPDPKGGGGVLPKGGGGRSSRKAKS